MSNSKESNRKKRGEISIAQLNVFSKLSGIELIELLKSSIPIERTIAAKLLGNRKSESAIDALCQALKTERVLYPKIAISEALGEIGLPALPQLIKLLGKIGNNQHKTLPEKAFEKKSYPLPRDIAARTITKMGEMALQFLVGSIPELEKEALPEAIDAIGFVSYYSGNHMAFQMLKNLLVQYKNNDLITWKLIRAFQSFPNKETLTLLETYAMNHPQKAIKCEAGRSIAQIKRKDNL